MRKATKRPEIAPGITVDRDESFGRPVVKGTDVEVTTILHELASGLPLATLESEYGLTEQGIRDALHYAYEILSEEPQARTGDASEVSPGVTIDPAVRFGRAVLKGTRVDVATVLGRLAAGESVDDVAASYLLTREAVRNALAYAETLLARETVSAH